MFPAIDTMPAPRLQLPARIMNDEPLRAVVQSLAECLVSHPLDLRLELHEEPDRVLIDIDSHRSDVGKLLGGGGENAKTLKTIANIIAERDFKWANVTILDGWTGERGGRDGTIPWTPASASFLTRRIGIISGFLFENPQIRVTSENNHTDIVVKTSSVPEPGCEAALRSIFRAYGSRHQRFVKVSVVP